MKCEKLWQTAVCFTMSSMVQSNKNNQDQKFYQALILFICYPLLHLWVEKCSECNTNLINCWSMNRHSGEQCRKNVLVFLISNPVNHCWLRISDKKTLRSESKHLKPQLISSVSWNRTLKHAIIAKGRIYTLKWKQWFLNNTFTIFS